MKKTILWILVIIVAPIAFASCLAPFAMIYLLLTEKTDYSVQHRPTATQPSSSAVITAPSTEKPPEKPSAFKVWKTIKIGGKSAEFYRKAFKEAKIDTQADPIFDNRNFTGPEREIDLVKVSVSDLGFDEKRGIPWEEIEKRIRQLGLETCPPETGFQLRIQYLDQPKDEDPAHTLYIGGSILPTYKQYKEVFDKRLGEFMLSNEREVVEPSLYLNHREKRLGLHSKRLATEYIWENRFIFVRPRK